MKKIDNLKEANERINQVIKLMELTKQSTIDNVLKLLDDEKFIDEVLENDEKNVKIHVKDLWIKNMPKQEFEANLSHHGAEAFDIIVKKLKKNLKKIRK